ncbi:hypothetical protein PTI98_007221 [Pleurotus ostreatus]|nr:hypothetical protein PTI98_007221 [Pleurotus ostreatus]
MRGRKELQAWVNNPYQDNQRGPYVISSIATYSLLAAMNLDLERPLSQAYPQPQGSVKLSGTSMENIGKLFDWPAVIGKAIRALAKYQTKNVLVSIELGEDEVANLYTIFNSSKKFGSGAKIVANLVLAAMGLRYAMEGKEVPETWEEVQAIKATELLDYRATSRAGPRALLIPLHQALTISPIILMETKDLTGKYVARHWHLLMWRHLGSARPEEICRLEHLIWGTVKEISLNPAGISDTILGLFNGLKQLTNYNDKSNTMGLEIAPETQSFFRQLEPLFPGSASSSDPTDKTGNQDRQGGPQNPPAPQQRPLENPPDHPMSPPSPGGPENPPDDPMMPPSPGGPENPPDDPVMPPSPAGPENPPDDPMMPPSPGGPENPPDDPMMPPSPGGPENPQDDPMMPPSPGGPENPPTASIHRAPASSQPSRPPSPPQQTQLPSPTRADARAQRGSSVQPPRDNNDDDDDDNDSQGEGGAKVVPTRGTKRNHAHDDEEPAGPSRSASRRLYGPLALKKLRHSKACPAKTGCGAQCPISHQDSPPAAEPKRNTRDDENFPKIAKLVGKATEMRFSPPVSHILSDTRGAPVEIQPSFHSQDDLNTFLALMRGIQRKVAASGPADGNEDGGRALIQVVSYEEYTKWTPSMIGEALKERAVLVKDLPSWGADSFSDAIMGLNRCLDAKVIGSDQSVEMGPEGGERHRICTLKEMIDIGNDPEAKSINWLDLPGPLPAGVPLVSEDSLDRICNSAMWSYPNARTAPDMVALTWTIAATPWTWHHLHVDTNGFGSIVVPKYGRKLWAVLRRKEDPFGSRPIDWQTSPYMLDDAVLDSGKYEIDYAILEPGTALVMPGGCPHMVVTLDESTVFMGSHFYQGRSIRRHMFSLVLTEAIRLSTNTEHRECVVTIIGNVIQMVSKACMNPEVIPEKMWEHLPDVKSTEGMKDVLVVCVVARLLPALFPMTGHWGNETRRVSEMARTLIRDIRASFEYSFTTSTGRPLDFYADIYEVYIQQVCRVYIRLLGQYGDIGPAQDALRELRECDGYDSGFVPGLRPHGATMSTGLDLSDERLDLSVEYMTHFELVVEE